MYVRVNTYEASTLNDHAMPYRCVHCDYQTTAQAYAYGKGSGLSPYGIDDEGAEARAGRSANRDARAQAALAIRIAPCPRCHRHDRAAMVRVYRAALAVCFAILVGTVLLLAWGGQSWGASVVVGLGVGAVPAGLFWKHKTSQLTSRQVRFDAPSTPG